MITKVPRSASFPRRASMLPDEVILLLCITDFVVIVRSTYVAVVDIILEFVLNQDSVGLIQWHCLLK